MSGKGREERWEDVMLILGSTPLLFYKYKAACSDAALPSLFFSLSRCPKCNHNEAVFYSSNTEQGMTLYFTCMSCTHKWRDYV